MQAITTIYKNIQFRSRLEARWAVFFDTLNIEWKYEPLWDVIDEVKAKWDRDEGCYVEDDDPYDDPSDWDEDTPTIKTGYCPDFYLPKPGIWIEVKPKEPTFDERYKARRWAEIQDTAIIILFQPLEPISVETNANWLYRSHSDVVNYVRWIVGNGRCGIGSISPNDNRQKDIRLLEAYYEATHYRF